jgi:pullulanase/glycogen debranching enzyme
MKKLNILAVIMILIIGIVSCSNENILIADQDMWTNDNNICNVTVIAAINGRGWTPALYRLTATNKAGQTVNVPDSTESSIVYDFDKGDWTFILEAFDSLNNKLYRGKTEVSLNADKYTCEIFALKNSGNITVDISEYSDNEASYDKIYVTAEKQSFDTQSVELNHFGEKAVFEGLAAGEWKFTIYSVSGTKYNELGSLTQTVDADLITKVTAHYTEPTPTTTSTSSTTTSSTTTSSTSTTSTTTTIPFTGYRVHVYGDNWSSHSAYYYSGSDETKKVDWPGKTMVKGSDTYYYDMAESWVAAGDTRVIFYGGSNDNRYPADQLPGVVYPAGVKEAWFNIGTKEWAASNPFSTDPVVTITPAGNVSFSGASQSVSITSRYCSAAKYTTDGSDPASSSTAKSFSGSTTITVGSTLSVGQSVTVRVYGTDGSLTVAETATYTKIDKPATPTRLGAYYTSSATAFSIWSPDSSNVTVTVTPKNGTAKTYTCTKGFTVDGGYSDTSNIYGVTVPGDLHLAEYQFKIGGKAVRDPYGKMVKYDGNQQKTNVICNNTAFYTGGPVGSSWAGCSEGIVIDAENIEPTGGWAERPALANRCDSIVYEVHIGDFTSSLTWGGTAAYAGKYPGMVEAGTKYGSTKTGLDHLKELGITHVQIMPMYDFATKYVQRTGEIYNWGYDPVNYNVPEDRYSTCPGDYVERIREVKNMINEFHKAGIRVVMDVVYNHTFANEMFDNITKKYYTAKDLSGCGNSVDVSNAMVSRMVRDSLEYWAEVYNVDGFRFDLMAIFTASALYDWGNYLNNTNAETKDRNLLMQGEPWQCNNNNSTSYGYASAIPGLANAHIGCFAGKWRETLKGSSDDGNTLGYIFSGRTDKDGSGTLWNTTVGLKGSGTGIGSDTEGVWTRYFTANPEQAVNYLMAHDNLCFYDKIAAAGTNFTSYADAIVKFGHGILLTAQGIPFIHAGDEFLRTKKVGTFASEAHNSYMWGQEMNQINWALKAANSSCFKYHKDMIAFRKANDGLRNRNGVGETSISGNVIYYTVRNSSSSPSNANKTITAVINPGSNITVSDKGTMAINKTGAVSGGSTTCEGTGVTIFVK